MRRLWNVAREFDNNSKFAIVGPGGVGGYLGGLLLDAGLDVTFVARPKTAEVLRAEGLILETVEKKIVLPTVKAVDHVSELSDVDVVLLTTKSFDLSEVAQEFGPEIRENSTVITFQNGLEGDRIVSETAPGTRVFPGVAYIVAKKAAPGLIQQTAGPRTFEFGDRTGEAQDELRSLALVMRHAGVDVQCSENIEKALWTKLIWIAAFSGVTGVTRTSIGNIVNDPAGMKFFEDCVDESIAVAQAVGVDVGDEQKTKVMAKAVGYQTVGGGATSSLALDISNGRPTELEAIHGALVRLASEARVDVPVLSLVYNAIRIGHEIPLGNHESASPR
ncbi:MAG: 2-dehydropantoate 2-reductase [Bdellovibrionales bacterium]|nr:2-dehydropantoate 2-reductase [Bdellovibrionales bacterium]